MATKKWTFTLLRVLPYLIIAGILWFLVKGIGEKGWLTSVFKPKPVKLENTTLVLAGIKGLATLQTAKMYAEVVVDSTAMGKEDVSVRVLTNLVMPYPLFDPIPAEKKLVIIAKGWVVAGVDLQQLQEKDIVVNKDSVSINLPTASITEVIMNPSDIEIFDETGRWEANAIQQVQLKAKNTLLQKAAEKNLLATANQKAVQSIGSFLRGAGFRAITINGKKFGT
jgi:hypothetical protein